MRIWDRLLAMLPYPDIAIFHRFRAAPYGGSNQFLTALRGELRRRKISVAANLVTLKTRAALLNAYAFDADLLRRLRHSQCRIVQRVDGPVGRYRGADDGIDRRVHSLNHEFAAATIFQSQYSLDAHSSIGLRFIRPIVIPNAVDPTIFHPRGRMQWDPGRKIRLISTSWSDNPSKGAATYKWIEENLDWTRFEYTFIGRSAQTFDRIRTLSPLSSADLAVELRGHDIYVTASRHDSCPNALLEALACGLPSLALRSGGHPELLGSGGLLFEGTHDVLENLDELVKTYETRQRLISFAPITEVADRYLSVLLPADQIGGGAA